jgi:phage regulator Rha-like protein
MSSREIADLVESRHDSVKRTIERLAEKGVIRFTPTVETSHEGAGARDVEVYRIGKRDSYVVVAQLSPEFTARLVDRWQELEAALVKAIPSSFAAALQLAADQAREIEAQQSQIADLSPKANKYDAFVSADGLIGYQNAGRELGCRPRMFTDWLQQRFCFHQGGVLIPRQQYVSAGYFVVKSELGTDDVVRPRGYVTPKGLDYLADHVPSEIVAIPPAGSTGLLLFNRTEH